jgi:hypothetical protein
VLGRSSFGRAFLNKSAAAFRWSATSPEPTFGSKCHEGFWRARRSEVLAMRMQTGDSLRMAEIAIRALLGGSALILAVALLSGWWSPSLERVGQWLLALALIWACSHLIRTVVGAICDGE